MYLHHFRFQHESQPVKSRVQKWGNSLAVRIPKAFADEAGLRDESAVEVSLVKGKLVVAPIATKPRYTLKSLLAQITEDNLHQEIETGPAQGNEAW